MVAEKHVRGIKCIGEMVPGVKKKDSILNMVMFLQQ